MRKLLSVVAATSLLMATPSIATPALDGLEIKLRGEAQGWLNVTCTYYGLGWLQPDQRRQALKRLMLLIAAVIALAMKIVGVLLVTSLLIIPAAAARPWSRTPEQMALIAGGIGVLSVFLGLGSSFHFDTPSGPSIVLASVLMFLIGQVSILRTGKERPVMH